jgi:Mrp family chromosome partitioning ATPase/capsular polysaccharide biosynthesis protein
MDSHSAEGWEDGPTLLEAIWRYRLVVLAVTILCGLAGVGLAVLQPAQYEATAYLLLSDPGTVGAFRQELGGVDVDMQQYRGGQLTVITSKPVEERAANILGRGITARQIRERVRAEPIGDSNVVALHATDATAERAAAVANVVVAAYQQLAAEVVQARTARAVEELQRTIRNLRDRIETLEAGVERDATIQRLAEAEGRVDQIRIDAAAFGSGVEFFEPATPPTAPSRLPFLYGLAGAILGMFGATAFAYWRRAHNALDRHDPAVIMGAPLLGEIPEFRKTRAQTPVPTVTDQASATAAAYQFVAVSLRFALEQHGGNTVLITSPVSGDGKTVTAINVAIAAEWGGHKILLVDGDQRQRRLSRLCEMVNRPGLTDIAVGQSRVEDTITAYGFSDHSVPRRVPADLTIEDTAGFLCTSSVHPSMAHLKKRADLVMIDSPPILTAAEVLSIASQADGVIVVIRRGTPMKVLQEARQQLDLSGTPLLGYVFNRADTKRSRYHHHPNATMNNGPLGFCWQWLRPAVDRDHR